MYDVLFNDPEVIVGYRIVGGGSIVVGGRIGDREIEGKLLGLSRRGRHNRCRWGCGRRFEL